VNGRWYFGEAVLIHLSIISVFWADVGLYFNIVSIFE
jgi:hypothetical protein